MRSKDGKTKDVNCEFHECKLKQCGGCRVKNCEAIKVVMKGTGGLLRHVKACRGDAVYDDVRSSSKSSNVYKGPDGQLVEQLPFKELLPPHVRFVIFCFTHWDHFRTVVIDVSDVYDNMCVYAHTKYIVAALASVHSAK